MLHPDALKLFEGFNSLMMQACPKTTKTTLFLATTHGVLSSVRSELFLYFIHKLIGNGGTEIKNMVQSSPSYRKSCTDQSTASRRDVL